jgi:hypothetical protein
LFKPENISEFPEQLSKYFVLDINIRPTDGAILLYVPKDKISDRNQKGFVTTKQLTKIKSQLSQKYNYPVEVIYLKSRKAETFELGIQQMLNQRFDGKVEQLYLSMSDERIINVWIMLSECEKDIKQEIESTLSNILKESALKKGVIQWIDSKTEVPSVTTILRAVKSIQPSTLRDLLENLSMEYPDLSSKWLNKQLDKMIKGNFLIRENLEKTYALSSKGLSVIPNSMNRNSSDVLRALALARKKW